MENDTAINIDWSTDKGFEQIFKSYFNPLYRYAFQILQDDMEAEEIVQNIMLDLWQNRIEKRKQLNHLQAYLYKMVYNRSLNRLEHEKVKRKYVQHSIIQNNTTTSFQSNIDAVRLQQKISEGIAALPEKCSLVFQKCRFEEKSYKEVAAELNISIKTVEHQMSKALKTLRVYLKDFMYVLLFFLFLNWGG